MKLIIGALALTMALTACGSSGSSSKGNSKPIDGNFVGVSDTNVLDYMEINDGLATNYEVDLNKKTYAITKMAVNMKGDIVDAKPLSHSCFGDIQNAEMTDNGSTSVVLKDGILTTSDSEGSEQALQVNAEQSAKIKAKISSLELIEGDGCEDKLADPGTSVSIEATKKALEVFLKD